MRSQDGSWYGCDVRMIAFHSGKPDPEPEPLLDRAGVEAARLVQVGRDQLVSSAPSVTYPLLAEARGTSVAAVRQWVKRRRADGLITIERDGGVLIPSFQFNDEYELDPNASRVVRRFLEQGMSNWAIWRWFYVENPWLDARPVDVAAEGGWDRVVDACRRIWTASS